MFKTQRLFNLALIVTIACITTLFVANATGQKQLKYIDGNDVKTVLFKDANTAMKAAKKAQADVLAPKNFGEAMKRYQKAETDLKQGKNLDDIRKNLRESSRLFPKSHRRHEAGRGYLSQFR